MKKGKIHNFIIWERPCYPGLIHIAAESVVLPHIKYWNRPWGRTYGFWSKGMVRFAWHKKEFLNNAVYIAKRLLDDNYLKSQLKIYKKLNNNLAQQKSSIAQTKLSRLSDKQFLSIVTKFNKVYLDWWGFTQVAEPAAAGLDWLMGKSAKLNQDEKGALTAPVQKSYTLEEEEKLFKLALLYKKNNKISKPELVKLSQQYFWLNNGYAHTYFLDHEYFRKQIMAIAAKMSAKQIIKALQANTQNSKMSQKNAAILAKKLSLSKEQTKIAQRISWLADFQDKRKALSLEANYYLDLFIKETTKRTGISYNLLRYALPFEYSAILQNKFSVARLKLRRQYFAIVVSEKEIKLFEGSQAQRYEKKLLGKIFGAMTSGIEGQRAFGGKIIGKARVILKTKNISSMKRGEVLVTTMTSPDFIAAMKKAAAIVTDEGGLTCHAAIISRELNIPCVVGTKVATRTLKTGDRIEVDANHGIVRKI